MTAKDPKTPWPLVCLLVGAGVLSAFQVGKVPPMLHAIRQDLGISFVDSGWILSIFNLIGMVMGTFAGAFADGAGHRRMVLAGLACQAVGSLLGAVAPALVFLLVSRFLEGLGFLSVVVSVPPLVFRVARAQDLKLVMGIWSCYLPAGACLMMGVIPWVIRISDWKGLWLANSLLILLYALWLGVATRGLADSGRRPDLKRLLSDIRTTVTAPGPLLLGMIFACYAMQWLSVMGFLPTLLLEKYRLDPGSASLLTGLVVFMNVPGNLLGGWLLNLGVRRWKLIALASAAMGLCAAVIYAPVQALAVNYAGCLVFSLAGGLIPASVLGGAPVYAPSSTQIATTTGILVQGGQTGQVLGPPVLAFLVSSFGTWTVGAWFLGGVAVLGTFLGLRLARISRCANARGRG